MKKYLTLAALILAAALPAMAAGAAPMDYAATKAAVTAGVKKGNTDAVIGKSATLSIKNPDKGGYMQVSKKEKLYFTCSSGGGKYTSGTVTGKIAGVESFNDGTGAIGVTLEGCVAS